ncbi:hypothetical protein [Hymenobacter fodinae]|uniref:Lipoprotein n=1 Tax=Hymenobacter fodinae TaxID=2510796 RepID=A0A4Z0PBD7_9BACT|nr:hypothetical protein [Hymenobacter fodinae]TGE09947.1 hypothetical protein EU556_03740 [Hymenobacter fodinae]
MHVKGRVLLGVATAGLSACETNHMHSAPANALHSYEAMITEYLAQRAVEPQVIINTPDTLTTFNGTTIRWREYKNGVLIIINGLVINTNELTTFNNVWGNEPDSLSAATAVTQIKYYKSDNYELTGLTLMYQPCNGLACGVAYHILFDHQTGQTSCFGRFSTGLELDLYRFGDDYRPDYLGKTFHGRSHWLRDTTVFTYYQLADNGRFALSKDPAGRAYYFKHMTSDSDSIPENFEEHWVAQIQQ